MTIYTTMIALAKSLDVSKVTVYGWYKIGKVVAVTTQRGKKVGYVLVRNAVKSLASNL